MAWIWSTWEEFVESVNPHLLVSKAAHRVAQRSSQFNNLQQLMEAVSEFRSALDSLAALRFKGLLHEISREEFTETKSTHEVVTRLVRAGEDLLFRHSRLAKTDYAYGYLHQHGILEHWIRFDNEGNLPYEISQLVRDAKELLRGFEQIAREDEDFLLGNLDLPDQLLRDFRLARDLFSVGFDDVGLLISGRGLEAVLRGIADLHDMRLDASGKEIPLSEASFYDLIEAMYHCRPGGDRARMISLETRQLLHFLRSARNARAHPQLAEGAMLGSPRDAAGLVARLASQLWETKSQPDEGLRKYVVRKSWGR